MGFVGLFKLALKCFFDVLAWPLLALGYPLCASIRAIETNSNSDAQKLITYWVSFSMILLFELAFVRLVEWLHFWAYIKLMIVCCLIVPHFDGSGYVYRHLIRPCISLDPQIVIHGFNKLQDLFVKKDDIFVQLERYVKENGPEAFESIIAVKKKNAMPNLVDMDTKALTEVNLPKSEEPKVTDKDISIVEIKEKKELASVKQVGQKEPELSVMENKTYAPLQVKESTIAALPGNNLLDVPSLKKVQKEWTSATCRVTTTSEADLHSHLQGNRHRSACQQQKAKNQTSKGKVSPVSVITKPGVPATAVSAGTKSGSCSEAQGKCIPGSGTSPGKVRYQGKKQGKQEIPSNLSTETRNSQWWCSICNISGTGEVNLNSHLNGRKHLAKIRALSGVGSSVHA